MARFNLSDEQAEAILNLRLRHLAKLEEHQLQAASATSLILCGGISVAIPTAIPVVPFNRIMRQTRR